MVTSSVMQQRLTAAQVSELSGQSDENRERILLGIQFHNCRAVMTQRVVTGIEGEERSTDGCQTGRMKERRNGGDV